MTSDTLIGDYLFDSTDYGGGSGTTILDNDTYSGHNNDLTKFSVSGGSGAWSTDHPGTTTPFDGTYSYDCNNFDYWQKELSSTIEDVDFSICIWINTNGNDSPNKNDSVFSSTTSSGSGFQITCRIQNDTKWYVNHSGLEDPPAPPLSWEIQPYNFSDSTWHHIAITYDYSEQELKTYWDGSLTNTHSSVTRDISEFTHITLGVNRTNTDSSKRVFNGSISAARVYEDRILTESEINNIIDYNSIAGSGGAVGDPHITTLNNLTYKFNYLGPFRLFDNNAKELNNRLIINGYSMNGAGRWRDKQYI